jgi:hypothetical protein
MRDPQGQRSFLPSFSDNSLLPWTIRTPRFTFVSDGNPLRRLLIVSKKTIRILAYPWSTAFREKRTTIPGMDTAPIGLVHVGGRKWLKQSAYRKLAPGGSRTTPSKYWKNTGFKNRRRKIRRTFN